MARRPLLALLGHATLLRTIREMTGRPHFCVAGSALLRFIVAGPNCLCCRRAADSLAGAERLRVALGAVIQLAAGSNRGGVRVLAVTGSAKLCDLGLPNLNVDGCFVTVSHALTCPNVDDELARIVDELTRRGFLAGVLLVPRCSAWPPVAPPVPGRRAAHRWLQATWSRHVQKDVHLSARKDVLVHG